MSKSPASGGGAKRFADLGVHRLILNPPTRADQAELLSYVAQAERDLTGKV